ncbi:MAG TPA: polysaccharide deacetylase family protein [Terriglobia bacterium]|nr:polysaccharide deacetylase family protein [Terriglobia bacterium]
MLAPSSLAADIPATESCVPILLYHRLGKADEGLMTVTAALFAEQMRFLQARGYHVITMGELVSALARKGQPLPERSVVITADDGNASIFTEMFPIIKENKLHVTLFIYPSAISNASYALTWEQLQEMQSSGLIDVQSHSYWHPDFHVEKARLAPAEYRRFVADQFTRSKEVLERKLGRAVTMLAWPFGIHDEDLMQAALAAGYGAAVTIERRPVTRKENIMTLPRYIVTQQDSVTTFPRLLSCPPAPRVSLKQ